jgi:hypothetical protein
MSALRELIAAAEAAGWDVDPNNAAILNAARDALPELLAALSELLAEAEEFHNPHTEGWNMARAAIAKATGGEA